MASTRRPGHGGKARAQGLVEYGLILVLIMVVVVLVVAITGDKINLMFSTVASIVIAHTP